MDALPSISKPLSWLECFLLNGLGIRFQISLVPGDEYSPWPFFLSAVFSFLSRDSLLKLRRVSKIIKNTVESFQPGIFETVYFNCPLLFLPTDDSVAHINSKLSILHNLVAAADPVKFAAPTHLVIRLRSDESLRSLDGAATFAAVLEKVMGVVADTLTHVTISFPSQHRRNSYSVSLLDEPVQAVLLRSLLEGMAEELEELSHISFENLTEKHILGLRCSGLTTVVKRREDAEWAEKRVWLQMKKLDIQMVAWWDGFYSSEAELVLGTSSLVEDLHRGSNRSRCRQALLTLHDWLGRTFSENLESLTFGWHPLPGGLADTMTVVNEETGQLVPADEFITAERFDGPNPFLLDLVAADSVLASGRAWFSAPPITWTRMRSAEFSCVQMRAFEEVYMLERTAMGTEPDRGRETHLAINTRHRAETLGARTQGPRRPLPAEAEGRNRDIAAGWIGAREVEEEDDGDNDGSSANPGLKFEGEEEEEEEEEDDGSSTITGPPSEEGEDGEDRVDHVTSEESEASDPLSEAERPILLEAVDLWDMQIGGYHRQHVNLRRLPQWVESGVLDPFIAQARRLRQSREDLASIYAAIYREIRANETRSVEDVRHSPRVLPDGAVEREEQSMEVPFMLDPRSL